MVIKPPPRKVIVEWILSAWNDISCETIPKSFKSCALTTALGGDEDDQIYCFMPEENPIVTILGDIAEATPTEMLIDERTKRETKKLMNYYNVLLLKVTQFNKRPVSNSAPSRLSPQG